MGNNLTENIYEYLDKFAEESGAIVLAIENPALEKVQFQNFYFRSGLSSKGLEVRPANKTPGVTLTDIDPELRFLGADMQLDIALWRLNSRSVRYDHLCEGVLHNQNLGRDETISVRTLTEEEARVLGSSLRHTPEEAVLRRLARNYTHALGFHGTIPLEERAQHIQNSLDGNLSYHLHPATY